MDWTFGKSGKGRNDGDVEFQIKIYLTMESLLGINLNLYSFFLTLLRLPSRALLSKKFEEHATPFLYIETSASQVA